MNLFEYWEDRAEFQIGQCRILVNLKETEEFYAIQPKVTDNCNCGNCEYFSNTLIQQSNPFFDLLKKMKVDLRKQPNIQPDGICCIEQENGEKAFIGYYYVVGEFLKTTKKTKIIDLEGNIISVSFNNAEFGKNVSLTIKQVEKDKLVFEFYIKINGSS